MTLWLWPLHLGRETFAGTITDPVVPAASRGSERKVERKLQLV